MKIFQFREWMIDGVMLDAINRDNVPDSLLIELGWHWVDAYAGRENHHPLTYGYWSTFDPEVVKKTKDRLCVRVTTNLGERV